MDFSILYAIQSIRFDLLDKCVVSVTNICGSKAQIWLVLGAILLIFKKTRKMGAAVLLSYGIVWVVGQDILKDLIARPRPCHIDDSVKLLISKPTSYSCPSTHSGLAMAMAISVYLNNKKAGVAAILVAIFICFTRMYLFVHFPSDVLLGCIIGIVSATISAKAIDIIFKKIGEKHV